MKTKAYMVCHTHWDREWYFTKEEFRVKLIRLIDGLLDIVETDSDYVSFMLDGQTIAIEDYLEIKPYNKERLFAALQSGKIVCGPWYILPDELLVSGESHIRNFLKGREVLKEAGKQMKIGYLPDSFGHPCQMPQILAGLGLEAMVFWRGTSNQAEYTEFNWESSFSESKILCIHMPSGYGNCANLSADMDVTLPRVENLISELSEKSTRDMVLLMNGSDHIIGQDNIMEIIKQLNAKLTSGQIEASTMERYLDELRPALQDLKTYRGEFRSGERSMLLGGTLSTRGYLKKKNTEAEDLMERYLEPMLSEERLLGGSYDSRGYMDYIWKKILENQPHDSICGCSIDEVHQEMMTRYANLNQLETKLLADTTSRIQMLAGEKKETDVVQLFLFEPVNRAKVSYLEAEIALDRILVQEVNFAKSIIEDYEDQMEHPALPNALRITDEQGREIPHVLLRAEKGYDTLYQDHTAPEIYKANQVKALLLLPPMEYGFHVLNVEACKEEPVRWEALAEAAAENEYYRVWIQDGGIAIQDKKRDKVHFNAFTMIDGGDAGDEYTYSWPQEDRQITLDLQAAAMKAETAGDIGQRLFITGAMKLPLGLNEDRQARSRELIGCPFTLEIGLYQGIERVDFSLLFDNQAMDHRLQAKFRAGIRTEYSESFNTFAITKRGVEMEIPEDWMEYPQSTHPTHGFVNLEAEDYGLSVSVRGLNEFEAVKEGKETVLHLTLLRCVGWLSRTDLLTRHGNGGWTFATPEAQCLGTESLAFSLSYHGGSFREENAFGRLEKFRYPSYLRQLSERERMEPAGQNGLSFLQDTPGELALSAVKPSEDQKGIIIRLYHIGKKAAAWSWQLPDAVIRAACTNLAEEITEDLKLSDGLVKLQARPGEIVTVRLDLK